MSYLKAGDFAAAHALYLSEYRVNLSRMINNAGELESLISSSANGYCANALRVNTTSSTAEESAAASQELSGQAAMLSSMVERFRLRAYR